jgi:hypothetical protein
MLGLWSNFEAPLQLASTVAFVTVATIAFVALRRRRIGVSWEEVARIGLVGSVLVVLLATALPRAWPPGGAGDLVLLPGRGGLADWRVLLEAPSSLAAVLLALNVVLYLPVGLFAGILRPDRPGRVLGGAIGLSVLVEAWQLGVIGRVASTDDVLLNASGAAIGLGLARWMTSRRSDDATTSGRRTSTRPGARR